MAVAFHPHIPSALGPPGASRHLLTVRLHNQSKPRDRSPESGAGRAGQTPYGYRLRERKDDPRQASEKDPEKRMENPL